MCVELCETYLWWLCLLACDVQVMDATWWSMVRGEGQARRAMPMDRAAVKDGRRAWTEGPEDTMRGYGRSSWCTEEQEYTELEMASVESRRMAMASLVDPGSGRVNDLKASWHLAEAGHASPTVSVVWPQNHKRSCGGPMVEGLTGLASKPGRGMLCGACKRV